MHNNTSYAIFPNSGGSYGSNLVISSARDIWYHVAVIVSETEGINCYINNELKFTIAHAGGSITGKFNLGEYASGGNEEGSLNDFRIYDHCLSPIEVKELSKGLVLHYPLSDGNIESTYNYLENKSFSNYGSYGFGSKGTISITTEVEPPIAGNEVALVTSSATTAGNGAVEIATSIYPGTIMNKDDTFTVTAYVKGKGATIGKRAHIHLYNTNGTNTQSTGKDYTFTNEWQRIEYTLKWNYDTPSNSSLNCYVVGYIAPQEQFYVSSIQVEKKDHSTPFTTNTRTSTIIYDASGYCNNGTINGNLTISTDTPKYSMSTYMSKTTLITHPRPVFGGTDQEWTCAMWVKLDNTSQGSQAMNNFNISNNIVHASNSTPLLYLNDGTNDYYIYGSQAVSAGVWTHVTFVFKNSDGTRNVYINGVLKNNYGPNKTSTPRGIPDIVTVGTNLAGYISDYRVYATPLSADDIKSLYQNEAQLDASGNVFGPIR